MSEAAELNPYEQIELEFKTLLEEVRQGSEEAAWKLIDRYGHHLLREVRRALPDAMRAKFDSVDFVQAVWASFFTSRSQIIEFRNSYELLNFLAAVARNKVIDERRRRMQLQKFNIRREISLDDRTLVRKETLPGDDPTPSAVAVAKERWQQLMADQPEAYRRAISLRFRGVTYPNIAKEVGMNERTVRRFLQKLLEE